jgi:tetratricopeptide (TPR) repeat protein
VRVRYAALVVALLATSWAQAADRSQEVAKRHFFAGQRLFDQANYAQALSEYQQSYALAPYPALLYKIALCQDQMGRSVEALHAYERYLELDPASARQAGVRERIDKLRAQTTPPLIPVYVPPTAAREQPRRPPLSPRTKLRIGAWVALGAALVFGAAGIGTAVVREQEAAAFNSDACIYNGYTRIGACRGHYDSATAQQSAEIASWVLAGAFAITTAALLAVARRPALEVGASVDKRGGGLACVWHF